MPNKKLNQLKAGAVLNYVVIFLNIAVNLLYTPYMLRKLGQSEFGLYSLVASIIAYLTVLDFGFGNAIVRYTAKYRATGRIREQYEMFGMFFILYLIIGAVVFLLGLILYFNVETLFGESMTELELGKARIMMMILIINLAFTFPMSIFGSIITAYEKFVFPRVINICRIALNTAVMICLLSMGYKAIAMVIVQTVFNITTLLLNLIFCKRILRIEMHFAHFDWSFVKEIMVYSLWIFLNVLMDKIYWSTGQFVLGAISGTIAVSIYAVAIHLHSFYMHFSSAVSNVFLPKVTSMIALNKTDNDVSELFIKVGRLQFIIIAFILSGFIIFGREFIILWAGPEYEEAFIISLLFFVSLFIPTIQTLGIIILQARNEMKFRSLLYLIIAGVSLIFQICLAKQYGAIGCAIAVSLALFIGQGIIMNNYYARVQRIDIRGFWRSIRKMAIVPIIMTVISLFVESRITATSWTSILLHICVFSLLYIPLFYRFSMNQYERNLMMSFVKKIKP